MNEVFSFIGEKKQFVVKLFFFEYFLPKGG